MPARAASRRPPPRRKISSWWPQLGQTKPLMFSTRPEHRHLDPLPHRQRLLDVDDRHLLRRRDHHRAGDRQELRQRQLRVAGAGRQIDDQIVELAPLDVLDELLQELVDHRPAPDDRAAALDEEADRDDAHAVVHRGHDLVAGLDRGGLLRLAHHLRDRRAVDVGVEDAHRRPQPRERRREVGADRRLADAALAGRDRDDVLDARQARVRRMVGAADDARGEAARRRSRRPRACRPRPGSRSRWRRATDRRAWSARCRRRRARRRRATDGHHSGGHEVDLQCGILCLRRGRRGSLRRSRRDSGSF